MQQSRCLLLVIISTALIFGCAQRNRTNLYPEIPITIKAEIIDYYSRAMNIDYDDGSGASYDATMFKIISPEKYAGKEILIYHNVTAPSDSIYRQKGLICEFIIDERAFTEEGRFNFIEAIEKSLKIVK